jgi:hypothetical protein
LEDGQLLLEMFVLELEDGIMDLQASALGLFRMIPIPEGGFRPRGQGGAGGAELAREFLGILAAGEEETDRLFLEDFGIPITVTFTHRFSFYSFIPLSTKSGEAHFSGWIYLDLLGFIQFRVRFKAPVTVDGSSPFACPAFVYFGVHSMAWFGCALPVFVLKWL